MTDADQSLPTTPAELKRELGLEPWEDLELRGSDEVNDLAIVQVINHDIFVASALAIELILDEDSSLASVALDLTKGEMAVLDYVHRHKKIGLESLEEGNPLTGEAIASEAFDRASDGHIKAVLRGLVTRGLLGNGRHHGRGSGYFLTKQGVRLIRAHAEPPQSPPKSGPGQD